MHFLIVIFSFFNSLCSTDMNINDFSKNKPKFKLEEYFNGKTEAWGMFHDRFAILKDPLRLILSEHWNQIFLTLDEKFVYDDGEKDTRIWTIKILGDNKYSGEASDVVGKATGVSSGNALNWKYKLKSKG